MVADFELIAELGASEMPSASQSHLDFYSNSIIDFFLPGGRWYRLASIAKRIGAKVKLSNTGVALFIAAVAFAGVTVPSAADAASASPRSTATPEAAGYAHARSAPLVVEPDCYVVGGDWCIWSGINGDGALEYGTTSASSISLRNLDGSVENSGDPYNLYLRLYYSPNYGGAWVCLNPGVWLANTANYKFNNGSGYPGYEKTLYDDVASVRFNTDPCSNPTG
jgi:hypothetical protein